MVTTNRPRYQYHLHGTLLAYVLVTLLIAVGAFNSNNNLLFFLFGLSIALLLIGGVHSGSVLMGVRVERAGVWAEPAGGTVRTRYRLVHGGRRITGYALRVTDEPAGGAALLDGPLQGFCPFVRAGDEAECEAVTRSTRRGELVLGPARLLSEFPFGLVRKSVVFNQPARVVIHPAEVAAPELARRLLGRRGRGDDPSVDPHPRHLGEEFFSLREYQPGDSPRLIAWRPSARRHAAQPWLVRQYAGHPPPGSRLVVVLELLPAADEGAYEAAVSSAAAIVRLAQRTGLPVGIEVAGFGVTAPAIAGRRHAAALLDDLALLPAFASARARPALATTRADSGRDVLRLVVRAGGETTLGSEGEASVLAGGGAGRGGER